MNTLEHTSLTIANYKCFGKEGAGYSRIRPINLIVGRNNSGKSALVDLLEYACSPKDLTPLQHKGQKPIVLLETPLRSEDLLQAFQVNTSGGDIGGNHGEYGQRFVGRRIASVIEHNSIHFSNVIDYPEVLRGKRQWNTLAQHILGNPFLKFTFKRLLADRDLVPEADTNDLNIRSNGGGATNALQRFINLTTLPRELVEKTLLNDLNAVFQPDGYFSDLTARRNPDNAWEIFLQEEEKGLVSLMHSGSGVKTILLVLMFLHLIPYYEQKPLDQYIFGFEELENNLHPALQRRLLLFLRKQAESSGCHFFLTTHSNVCIDLFAHDDMAQILHVTHDRRSASAKSVVTYVDNKGILDDLDLRASDLLQANGLVWLEGPSDRLYFNRWMDLWTDGLLKEGAHYQCVFYGGRLLAHLSAGDPDVKINDVIHLLRVNRNAILLIDSDRRAEEDKINSTKTRLINEVTAFGGMAWVTCGKEIENYIPMSALQSVFGEQAIKSLQKHQNFSMYLDRIRKDEGKRFLRKKVLFTERVIPYITKDSLKSTLDLGSRLNEVVNMIRSWNRLGTLT